ncbi:MAG: DUF1232 domain-containing protein [Erysipelotrichaceae bacterium]|jgi:uncharacterized membrane protein YkvA (DUF1232 family)|nr:DUF1232 domain-containing protein [Erysipelotrichaceae bacterium]
MANEFNLDKAKEVLDAGMNQAQELIQDPSKINDVLDQVQEKIKDIPVVGTDLANIPTMISMVKSYVTKEYTEVSPKVVAALVSALLYVLKGRDLIPDAIPILGQVDDVAVIAVAMKLIAPEIEAFKQWQAAKETA